jgi:hypothetical protein
MRVLSPMCQLDEKARIASIELSQPPTLRSRRVGNAKIANTAAEVGPMKWLASKRAQAWSAHLVLIAPDNIANAPWT